jgi:hypothetical protein
MNFQYTTNVWDVIKELDAARGELRPAVVRALNRTINRVKVRAAREVRAAGYKLKISVIKAAMRITPATAGRLRADAVARGRPIPLVNWSAKQTGDGVSVDVLQGRKLIAHAFIATMPSGHKGVFERFGPRVDRTRKSTRQAKRTQRIKQLFGPSIPDALANKAVERALIDLIDDTFARTLAHELAWLKKRLDRLPANPADD